MAWQAELQFLGRTCSFTVARPRGFGGVLLRGFAFGQFGGQIRLLVSKTGASHVFQYLCEDMCA